MVTGNKLADLVGDGLPRYEFKIHRSSDQQYYWTLHSTVGNKEAVAQSERYTRKASAEHSIDQVKKYAESAKVTDMT